MDMRRLQRMRIAAWFGVVALGLNALVPIHLAFDLAEAFAAVHEERAPIGGHDYEWRLLALLGGHLVTGGTSGDHNKQRPPACPVCSSLVSLGGFAPTAGPALSLSVPAAATTVIAATADAPEGTPALAYRSRAPPLV